MNHKKTETRQTVRKGLPSKRTVLLFLMDCLWILAVETVCYVLVRVFQGEYRYFSQNSLLLLLCLAVAQILFGIYRVVWRYPTTKSYLKIVFADGIGGCVALLISSLTGPYFGGPWFYLSVAGLSCILILSSRFVYRLVFKSMNTKEREESYKPPVNVAVAGAGQLGVALVNDLLSNPKVLYRPRFFVDTNPDKIGLKVCSLPVYAPDENLKNLILEYEITEVFIAISSLNSEGAEALYRKYTELGCKVKLYDSPIHGDDNPHRNKQVLREFRIEDLLFREEQTFGGETFRFYAGKRILVTGGGGSIGSELCRQLAKCNPAQLIIFDIYENNAYEIQQELIRKYGDNLDLKVEIGSVRDVARLECLFRNYRPEVVFHAAAHKHVPLMEQSSCEAIKNNVFGTYNVANVSEKYGVSKFVMISTDKAVNPTNIMGASKRLCEMIILCRKDSETTFTAVRFGNVLGSNGSVIPLFRKQIEEGGPVTVTDKRIIRYFMTIPEASQLVLTAGFFAHAGELFVLDMGKPVKIYDLAVNMIRLSGFEPDKDIMIEETGLRPGEKLYEELLMRSENLDKTANKMIFVERDEPMSRESVEEKLEILRKALEDGENELASEKIRDAIIATVPTFRDPSVINRTAEQSEEMKSVDGAGEQNA